MTIADRLAWDTVHDTYFNKLQNKCINHGFMSLSYKESMDYIQFLKLINKSTKKEHKRALYEAMKLVFTLREIRTFLKVDTKLEAINLYRRK